MAIFLGGNFPAWKFFGWELFILGGNFSDGSYPEWLFSGWELSGWEFSWVGIFLGGNFPGGNCRVGIIQVAIFHVGVFMLPSSRLAKLQTDCLEQRFYTKLTLCSRENIPKAFRVRKHHRSWIFELSSFLVA